MFGNRIWPAAALAAGLVALAACRGEQSVASKSAAAFEEARKKGQTFSGEGHSHGGGDGHGGHGGHGAAPSGSPQQPAAGGEHQHHAGHGAAEAPAAGGTQHGAGHGGMDHSAHGSAAGEQHPADHSSLDHGAGAHAGHAPQRSGSPRPEAGSAGHEGHTGHGAPPAQAPADHSGHAGHSASAGGTPSPAAPELPAQPASILRPDPLDAPAATSVADAQRSAEVNQEMSGGHGGHGGHGSGNYRHVDAGRGPDAHEGSEQHTPGAGPEHHDHGAEERQEAALYACPMHPEVTSKTPGTCPKCGMALVERREE